MCQRWRPLSRQIGLLTWPGAKRLYLIDGNGEVQLSQDGGKRWEAVGNIGGQPVALAAVGRQELYAALADGRVLESIDGGGSWDALSAS